MALAADDKPQAAVQLACHANQELNMVSAEYGVRPNTQHQSYKPNTNKQLSAGGVSLHKCIPPTGRGALQMLTTLQILSISALQFTSKHS